MKEIRLLRADDIEVKVKQVTAKGAILLLYKTARVDMAILDEVYGSENWTNDYRDIDGVLFCGIGVREDESKPFVWKWSNGIESREDGGNEKKGEASDAFKRAGFLVGIGRELYSSPFIFIAAETEQDGKNYRLKNRYAKFKVDEITYNDDRTINNVIISDQDGNIVFAAKRAYKKTTVNEEDFSTVPPKKTVENKPYTIDENVLYDIQETANATVGIANAVLWISKKFDKEKFELLTTEEANELLAAMKKKKEDNVA